MSRVEHEGAKGSKVDADPVRAAPSMMKSNLPPHIERVTTTIIGCAIEVHRHLGPGLLENLYETALAHELGLAGLRAERQVSVRVPYKSILLPEYVVDMVVERAVVVELKSIEAIKDVHKAQTLSYLRMLDLPVGLPINFNEHTLKEGVRRVINERSRLFPPSASGPSRLRVQPAPPSDQPC